MVIATAAVLAALAVSPGTSLAGTSPAPPTPAATSTPAVTSTPDAAGGAGQAEPYAPLCEAPAEGRFSCFVLRKAGGARHAAGPLAAGAAPDGYGPADLAGAYGLPSDGGAGQTVAIVVAFDAPEAEADLAVYRAQFGLPACTGADGCFRKVDQRGGTDYPAPDPGWAGEAALDLDMVSAVAPRAHILLVEADSNSPYDLGAAVDQAVAMGARFVSNSYGTDQEYSDEATLDVHYDHPGVAVVAASGDYGYGVSYPAASPYVTSVGGTSLVRDSSSRGWSETVWNSTWTDGGGQQRWGAPGSGCSRFEAKPETQHDSGCPGRTVADVSAVADPVTGVAVYNSYSDDGWAVYGGTSAATPIVTGVYAVAGAPIEGTRANTYPYLGASALWDVTKGDDASCPAGLCPFGTTPECAPSYLCAAQAGYDGPTGLGTPNGPAAFRGAPHGTVAGTVTDAGTGKPVSGALVTLGDYTATTAGDGRYSLAVPVGTYSGTVDVYGYRQAVIETFALADGQTVTKDVALQALPAQTVSGTVTDGGGHGWPLYAQVAVEGVPGAPVFTDPLTGKYSVRLPQGRTYTLTVTSGYPGYLPKTVEVAVGEGPATADVAVPVDTTKAAAPGYSLTYHGGGVQPFDTRSAPAGWTVKNNNENGGWRFDDPLGRSNQTGGGGGFAIVDDFNEGWAQLDTELRSPSYDLSAEKNPVVEFDTHFPPVQRVDVPQADMDVSVDGGTTWYTLWRSPPALSGPDHVSVSLTPFAGRKDVRVRFHYVGGLGNIWEVDRVAVGTRTFAAQPGGLVVGRVTDANTGEGVVGATVSLGPASLGPARAISVATPQDQAIGDGLYWLFSPEKGDRRITAEKAAFGYPALTRKLKLTSGVTPADFALKAGRITVAPASVSASVPWGGSRTVTVTVKNDGTAPASFTLGEREGGAPVSLQQTAGQGSSDGTLEEAKGRTPVQRVKTPMDKAIPATVPSPPASPSGSPATRPAPPVGDAWRAIADLAQPSSGMVAGTYKGKLYAGLGNPATGTLFSNTFASYDPKKRTWTTLESPWYRRWAAVGAFIGDRFYVTSGRDSMGGTVAATEIYDTGTGTWHTGTPNPRPLGSSGSAVLDGKLYVVGGCYMEGFGNEYCANADVMVYDPSADGWSKAAAYPIGTARLACGGIDGKVYCAGGQTANAYAYDPKTDKWSRVADMPLDLMSAASAVANGRLLVSTGYSLSQGVVTNEGFAYDPATNTWSPLPNAPAPTAGAAGASGFYLVGGSDPATGMPVATVEQLPGYEQPHADVAWLSVRNGGSRLEPGHSAKITVRFDADEDATSVLTEYSAGLVVDTDTPYQARQVPVTMRVEPPRPGHA
ncbi:carboxypeptidase regulatory-like domain-containing protein [Microbispora sp. RL4-1S]|uniref:Carboxypeptidase regulatory-like domain-containing protein n=1 Tax=Microbispora oryzae TaxID=2806554 RepID=A0A941AKS6_9ACTN|nr:carboxypeptidase regulatory-like domain-containing protein [Microbispora oryzae]MBP2705583.1 carboxypeptidase regulatory-like domain-containing protein [Microbispora oryzae]